jgi:hypothetical protein|tara:strand:- start:321 stop:539 length:219 start_codon:yes stop_codon:yes gene_type:complete
LVLDIRITLYPLYPLFEIRKILTSEGLKRSLGKKLGNNNVQSLYLKDKIREKRLKSQNKVTKTLEVTEFKGE